MYTLLIFLAAGAALAAALGLSGACRWGWAAASGCSLFLAGQILSALFLRKKLKAAMTAVQDILADGQKKLRDKVARWQMRPPGSLKQAQLEIERDQRVFIDRALEASRALDRFIHWVPLMKRQIATLRIQLHWMNKDFRSVDRLMPLALAVDPMIGAIKLARMHMLGKTDGMEKLFNRLAARLRYGQGALLYGLYSWILVQRKDYAGAHRVLIRACDKMENAVIKANRDALANNKIKAFSNAGLGEQWYALHLEEPKIKTQRPSHFASRHF